MPDNELDIELLKDELRRDEGYRCNVYRCSTGHKTIGYGHMDDSMSFETTCTRVSAELTRVQVVSKDIESSM